MTRSSHLIFDFTMFPPLLQEKIGVIKNMNGKGAAGAMGEGAGVRG